MHSKEMSTLPDTQRARADARGTASAARDRACRAGGSAAGFRRGAAVARQRGACRQARRGGGEAAAGTLAVARPGGRSRLPCLRDRASFPRRPRRDALAFGAAVCSRRSPPAVVQEVLLLRVRSGWPLRVRSRTSPAVRGRAHRRASSVRGPVMAVTLYSSVSLRPRRFRLCFADAGSRVVFRRAFPMLVKRSHERRTLRDVVRGTAPPRPPGAEPPGALRQPGRDDAPARSLPLDLGQGRRPFSPTTPASWRMRPA